MFVPTSVESSSSSSESSQLCRRFTFSEIQLATQNLDESLVIGSGGFGKVYKGTITNGSNQLIVAIKRLDSNSNQGASEFWAEVNMLSNLRHCHLVSLIGYCNDGQEMILVYEFMSLGSLEDHLHRRQTPLSWVQRLTICIGAARGLDYLHTGTGIKHGVIHRDVKSSNILLHDSWAAKISDFGLSKICHRNQQTTYVNTGVKGTFGYLDPDYFYTGKLTRKSDVYAFGVVLFEVLCGKRAVDSSIDEEQWALAIWAQDSIKEGRIKQIVDTNIRGSVSPKCLKVFAQLAKRCLHSHPKQRPTMAELVVSLESIIAVAPPSSGSHYEEDFMNETSILVKVEHENLVKLLGYCIEGKKSFLVYEFAMHARLDLLLFDPECTLLNWDKRYKIILGVARALLYLHRDAPIPILHGDVKSGNILLDESLNPKLSSFWNARCLDINQTDCSVSMICGTWGYMAPELLYHGYLSTKANVYSLGVLVLEIITGHRSMMMGDTSLDYKSLCQYVESNWLEGTLSNIIHPRIDVNSSSMTRFVEIGLLCVQEDAHDRPTMEEVVSMLLDSSCLTLPVANMRERITTTRERLNGTNSPVDDNDSLDGYYTGADEDDFISELIPR